MSKRSIILTFFLSLAALTGCFVTASAQEIDVYSLSYEELAELVSLIVNKLQQETGPETESEREGLFPAVYVNKKLVIEDLPNSMFIQRKQTGTEGSGENSGEISGTGGVYLNAGELIGTPCGNSPECKWAFDNGELYCTCGHLVP